MQNAPAYGIESVDRALRLAVLLTHEQPMRVAEVARRLDVARSTAHRLLAVLVHRGFAVQDPDRRYRAGPVLRLGPASDPVARLRTAAAPHLRSLVAAAGETAQLVVRTGTVVRFVSTVECDRVLRIGDREGRTLPAHLASGGLALLAALPDADVAALYADDPSRPDPAPLLRLLRRVRRRGFAVNDQATEAGVTAIGRIVAPGAAVPSAVSLAVPTVRYERAHLPELVEHLTSTATAIAAVLEA